MKPIDSTPQPTPPAVDLADPYEAGYQVRVYEADHTGCLTPVSLFNYLQETASIAAAARSRGRLDLRAHGLAWFLNRFHLRIDRYPRIGEAVCVRTWPFRMDRHASIREFEVIDSSGAPYARATSQWVLINLLQRRVTRVPEWLRDSYPVHARRMLEESFSKLPSPAQPEFRIGFHVRISDLDVNQHANSASYVDWCLEAVPEGIHERLVPVEFEIHYLREASVRQALTVLSQPVPAGSEGAPVFLHQIQRDVDGTRLALGRSSWEPRPSGSASEVR
jgi:medium-chain acyl-[acyl-carrier-protein] hydrolase